MKRGVFLFFVLGVSFSALGLDLVQPEWRGHPRSTLQIWEFNTPDMNPVPDLYQGPFNPQPADIIPIAGDSWIQEKDGYIGIWPLSGEVYVPIYNFPEPLDYKLIQIQLTWTTKGSMPNVEASGDDGPMIPGTLLSETLLDDLGWYHSTFQIVLQPNPIQELVHVYGAIYLDEMVIDTICIPEPATLGFMAVGGLFLLGLRKKG